MRNPNSQEIQLKENCLREMTTLRAKLIIDRPFTAALAMNLELTAIVDSRLQTAATDGEKIFFNACFMQTLNKEEKMFVLAHEVWHCAASHLIRRFDRDMTLWNYAADHEINSLLREDGFKIPAQAVFFKKMKGKNAEAVYDWLKNRANPANDLAGIVDFDQHDLMQEEIADPDPVLDPDFKPSVANEATRRKWQEIVTTVTEQCRRAGNISEGLDLAIGQLTKPTVPWKVVLRQFVQRVYGGSRSWWPPSRRYLHQGTFLPGMRADRLKIALAIDTSGSTRSYLSKFMAEFKGLLSEFDRCEVMLIECDCEIQRVTQFSESEMADLPSKTLRGGGGTDFRPVFELLAGSDDPVSCLVYLTDGEGNAPDQLPPFPVIWVLTPDAEEPPVGWGETVYLGP